MYTAKSYTLLNENRTQIKKISWNQRKTNNLSKGSFSVEQSCDFELKFYEQPKKDFFFFSGFASSSFSGKVSFRYSLRFLFSTGL